jgi:signal transduction histidine kinase
MGEALSASKFPVAMLRFWIGDTLGIVTIIPLVTTVFAYLARPNWSLSAYTVSSIAVFVLGTCFGFAALIGIGEKLYYLFNLLFLPIIWLAMREGYTGVAVGLVAIQLVLAVITVFVGYDIQDFAILQLLMLVLSTTGLLLGAVTTERRAAALLLREQKIELARMTAHAKEGAMGAALAHEISQPLSTIATYLHAAQRLLQSSVARAPVAEALTKAAAEARRAREVLERIRDFVSTGNLQPQLLDLPALAEKIAALCREEATARRVQIEIECVHPIPLVKADRIQIEQVLNNILTNAIEAASDRSDARGRVLIRLASRSGVVVIQVEDNGPGVAPELTGSIFEAYQTTKPRGMGLGLPLSQRIVQRHAGRIWWEPNSPVGARFVVTLPIDGSAQDAA